MKQFNLRETDKIEEIKDMNFHFTHKNNVKSIETEGLKAKIGNKSEGIEKNEKVFFSHKPIGVINLINNCYRLIQDILAYKENSSTTIGKDKSIIYERLYKTEIEPYDRNKEIDETIKDKSVRIMYEILKNYVYLKLDLKGVTKEIFDNLTENQKSSVDYLIDDIDEETNMQIEEHNMHTRIGKGIEPEKISQLTIDKRTDAIGIIEFLYNVLEKKPQMVGTDMDDLYSMRNLKSFIEYANSREAKTISMESVVRNALTKGIATEDVVKSEKAEYIEKQDKTKEGVVIND